MKSKNNENSPETYFPHFTKVCAVLLISLLSAVSIFSQKTEWTIADYIKNLPAKYITASGDFVKPTAKTIVIDEKNGYAVYMSFPQPIMDIQPFPVFQMCLFKSRNKPPLLVVSNYKSDEVCDTNETFFLRRAGNKWTAVKQSVVLPPLDLKMFFSRDAAQSAARLKKIVGETGFYYNFEPARGGKSMKVSLEICDVFEYDAPDETVKEIKKLVGSATAVRLEWDAANGKFKRWIPKGNWKFPPSGKDGD